MEYLKKLHMVCFGLLELKKLYKDSSVKDMKIAMDELGYNSHSLDEKKRQEIVNIIVRRRLKNKEDIEFFIVLTKVISFYGNDSKICFPLKNGYQPEKNRIKSIDDLKKATKEDTLTDFGIYKEGLRLFQLKQYRGELNEERFFMFIKKILWKYGNNLGDVNLLVLLQGLNVGKIIKKEDVVRTDFNIDFHNIYKSIESLKLNFIGEILVTYNEMNQNDVMHQLYPEFKTMKKPIDDNFLAGEILYN